MIAIEIRLESARGHDRDRILGVMFIANDGKGTKSCSGYDVIASKGPRAKEFRCRVENFPRSSRSVFELLRRALNAMEIP